METLDLLDLLQYSSSRELWGPPMKTSTNSLSAKQKMVKRTKEAIIVVLWRSYWCFHFCPSFPFLQIPTCLIKKVLNDNVNVTILIQKRILSVYTIAVSVPHLIASENWVLGELGSCLLEVMKMDVAQPFNILVNPEALGILVSINIFK
ncbi:hypothetical protein RYX36_025717 [Vicia faba]